MEIGEKGTAIEEAKTGFEVQLTTELRHILKSQVKRAIYIGI